MGTICTRQKSGANIIEGSSLNLKLAAALNGPTSHNSSPLKRNSVKIRSPQFEPKFNNQEAAEVPTGVLISKPPSSSDKKVILSSLNKHFLLKTLEHRSKEFLISQMKAYRLKPRELVFSQGQPGSCFYVVTKGLLEVVVNLERRDLIKNGNSFGELALIENTPRSATIRTLERSIIWALDRNTFKEALKEINEKDFEENLTFVNSVHLLEILTNEQKDSLANSFSTQFWEKNQKIVKEGDSGDLFYIIKEGMVVCSERGTVIRRMEKGDYFGELALLYNSTRTATVTCLTDVKVVSIGREKLIEVLGSNLDQVIYKNIIRIIMERSQLLRNIPKEITDRLIDSVRIVAFHEAESVVATGTKKNQQLIMILKGSLSSTHTHFDAFTCLGDEFLQFPDSRIYTEDLKAKGEVHIAFLERSKLEDCLGGPVSQIVSINDLLTAFTKIHLLRHLPSDKIRELLSVIKVQEFSNNECIVEQNTEGNAFYIVKEGTVEVFKGENLIRTIPKFDYFGERSLLLNDIRTASVVAKGPASCWVLNKQDFHSVVDQDMQKQLMKHIELTDDTVRLDDLYPVKSLGKGMFGNVYLTVHRTKNTLYSLKTVQRSKIEEYDIFENILLERKVLMEVDHPMIMKLVKTFKDSDRLYFLLEYVRGMDLFDVLRVLNLLKDKDAKFYTGCLVLIVEHLHSLNIVYRDLKPENLMVDDEGYLKLIDFGTAKILSGRTYTTIGTPHYMAPEVILGSGYSQAVDWWSIGIIIYEMLYGVLPFGDDEEDPHAVYEKVIEHRLVYPSFADPMSAVRSLIQQLLSKNPNSRTGGGKVKGHKWFSNFDWNSLICKKIKPPYIPQLKNLSEQIHKAINTREDLKAVIKSYEEKPSNNKRRAAKRPPANWDAVF